MSVVDASVWVSRFLPDDAFYAASRAWLLEAARAGRPLFAPTIMAAEVAGAIARRTGDSRLGYQVARQIRQTPGMQFIAIDDSLGMYAAQLASELRMRAADALYVAAAHRLQLPLVTWDAEQLERVGGVVVAHTP